MPITFIGEWHWNAQQKVASSYERFVKDIGEKTCQI